MEVKLFAVSVQWGKGIHYFRGTDLPNKEDAEQLAAALLRQELKKKAIMKLHAHPTVHVWHHESEFKG